MPIFNDTVFHIFSHITKLINAPPKNLRRIFLRWWRVVMIFFLFAAFLIHQARKLAYFASCERHLDDFNQKHMPGKVFNISSSPSTSETMKPKPKPRPKPKILILSYSNLKPGKLTQHSNTTLYSMVRCNHQTYAAMHGYDYHSPEPWSLEWNASRFVLNGLRYKTFAILNHFNKYEVLVWIDHDAVFSDMDLKIEYWLQIMNPASDMMMSEDLPGYRFNAGLQIIKTTNWTRVFYTTAIDGLLKTDVNAGYVEQPILYKLHDSLPGAKQKIHIYSPRSKFQAFLKVKDDFTGNSWVVHATQCGCDLGAYVQPPSCHGNNSSERLV